MGNDTLRRHMQPYEKEQRFLQNNDTLRRHIQPYLGTLNQKAQLSPFLSPLQASKKGVCEDEDVAKVARFIVNEMKLNKSSLISMEILRYNNIAAKAAAAAVIVANKVAAYELWISVVKNNAIWDHKMRIRTVYGEWTCNKKRKEALKFYYDIWSNIHYGFIGKYVGFSEFELLQGPGVAQVKDNNMPMKEVLEKIWKGHSFRELDHPKDQTAIKIGFDLYKNHKDGLMSYIIIEKLVDAYLKKEPINIEKCCLNHQKGF